MFFRPEVDLTSVLLQMLGKNRISEQQRNSCMEGLRDWSVLLGMVKPWLHHHLQYDLGGRTMQT